MKCLTERKKSLLKAKKEDEEAIQQLQSIASREYKRVAHCEIIGRIVATLEV